LERLKERGHLEDLGIDERIILKWVLGEMAWSLWIGFIWLRIGTGEGSYEHSNEPLGSIKGGKFLD
jgi:hypothetical protein